MLRTLSIFGAAFVVACTGPAESPPEREVDVAPAPAVAVESDDRPTVVFLGTSLTAGLGLDSDDDTYVARLGELATDAGLGFRGINAGVSGETSAGGLRRIDWALREPVDVLFLELGANDGLRGQDPMAMESNLTEIIRRTRARYPDSRIILAGMEAPPNLGELYTTAFRSVFQGLAEREDVDFIPFLLDGVAGVPELNQSDRIHPTADGHRAVAEVAWPVLERVLREVTDA